MHRGLLTAGVGLAAIVAGIAPALAAAPAPQPGVFLTRPATAHVRPDARSKAVVRVETYTRLTLRNAVYPVVKQDVTAAGAQWVKVRLPMRPNGLTGWIPSRVTRPVALPWRIQVSLRRKRAVVYRNGRAVRRFRVVVGARSTPTPRGHFYVVERVKLHTSWARGLWSLALSAHSTRLKHFEGGDGQVALHARGSLAAPLGTAASHGCVRFSNSAAAWLARVVPRGTPVDITR